MDWLRQSWVDFWQFTSLYPAEAAAVALLTLLFLAPPSRRAGLGAGLAVRFRRFAAKRRLAVAAVFLATFFGHLAVERNLDPPPTFHDEFSYLLAGDTYASGRLTNPPHPMRYFLESFHILTEPTYMSMYPPGQGLALAVGQVLGGKAIVGVWLSVAAACAAICWMLQGWTTPSWALLGGLIAMVRIGWFSYWGNSYWGGAVSMLAGALLLGAAGRLRKPLAAVSARRSKLVKPNVERLGMVGALLALGCVLLIYTRLWEGSILCATAWLCLLTRPRFRQRQVLVPFLAVSFAGASFLALANWSVTGNPLRLPYLENRERYQMYGSFIWDHTAVERPYDHDVIRRFYQQSEGYSSKLPYWQRQMEKPKRIWYTLIGPALTVPLLAAFTAVGAARLRLVWLVLGTYAAGHVVVSWTLLPHYAGPITGALYILLIEGLRRLGVMRSRQGFGVAAQRAALATVLLFAAVRTAAPALGFPVYGEYTLPWYSFGLQANTFRAGIEKRLHELGGKHLILVDYEPNHIPDFEWVYNRADIDGAAVVWARMTPRADLLNQLLSYYRDRRIWVIYPDLNPGRLLTFQERIR